MAGKNQFNGFPKEIIKFYKDLKNNNDKMWFEQNRSRYDDFVMHPSRTFISEMGKKLDKISPEIHADPRVNKSIFKIYRDIRFSKDKTPFKTHLAIWFWEGDRPRMECSGFYVHIEPGELMVGCGIYAFPKDLLNSYREAVVHQEKGKKLINAIKNISKKGNYSIGGEHYKKTPRGYDPDHKMADFLLYNGLYVGFSSKIPEEFYTEELINYCYEKFKHMAPLHRWLVELYS